MIRQPATRSVVVDELTTRGDEGTTLGDILNLEKNLKP